MSNHDAIQLGAAFNKSTESLNAPSTLLGMFVLFLSYDTTPLTEIGTQRIDTQSPLVLYSSTSTFHSYWKLVSINLRFIRPTCPPSGFAFRSSYPQRWGQHDHLVPSYNDPANDDGTIFPYSYPVCRWEWKLRLMEMWLMFWEQQGKVFTGRIYSRSHPTLHLFFSRSFGMHCMLGMRR